jgi:hypothetical protein
MSTTPPAPRAGLSRRTFLARTGVATVGAVAWAAGCSPAPGGGRRPGPGTTGVPAGTTLRRHDGDLRITTADQVVENLDIHGFVRVDAPGVTIRRCRIRGGPFADRDADPRGPVPPGGWPGPSMLFCPNGRGLLIEDCTILPDDPIFWIGGLKGYGFTARRLDVSRVQDTAMTYGDDCLIEACWFHDQETGEFDPRGKADGPSHTDGVQVQGGRNVRIIGNDMSGNHNAAIMVTQDHAKTDDLVIRGNWLDDGGVSLNISQKARPPITGVVVEDNRFGRGQRVVGTAGLYSPQTQITLRGNVWDDDGTPARIRPGA